MKKIIAIAGFLAGGLLLFFAVALFAFYHLMQAGEFRRFLTSEFEGRTGLKVEVGEARVEMGRVLGVSFSDFALREPGEGIPVVAAPKIFVRVALLPLLKRKLVFYGINLSGPSLQITRDERGRMPWLDLILRLRFQSQKNADFSLDLREIRIDRGEVFFTDRLGGKETRTRYADIDLAVHRVRGRALLGPAGRSKNPDGGPAEIGFDLVAKTVVERGGLQADLAFNGRALLPGESPEGFLDFKKIWWDADLKSGNLPAALLWEYYGRPLVDDAPRGNLAYRAHWEGSLARGAHLAGQAGFTGLEASAPDFPSPVALGSGRLDFDLDWKPEEIRFQRLNVKSVGLTFAAQGSLRSLDSSDPLVDLKLTTPFLPVASLRGYLPVGLLHAPRLRALAAGLDRGEVKFSRAEISGRLSELRRLAEPGQEERLLLAAEARGLGGVFGAAPALPVNGFGGQIFLQHGFLQLKNLSGTIGRTRVIDLSGTGRRPLSGGPLDLRIKADAELAELRELPAGVLPAADKIAAAVEELGGRARLDVALRADSADAPQVEGVVSLEGAHLRAGDIALSEIRGDLLVSPAEIRVERAAASFDGAPVQLRAALKDFDGGAGTFDLTVDSPGVKASRALGLLLSIDASRSPGIVRGSLRYQGSLASAENRKLSGLLELVGAQVPLKFFREPFRAVTGKVRLNGDAIDLEGVRAEAGGYPFALDGRWTGGEKPSFVFNLSAPEMDVDYILPHHVVPNEEWYERLQVRGKLLLDKGRYDSFAFTGMKTDLVLEKRIWRVENFFARSQGGTVQGAGAFNDRSEPPVITIEPVIKGVPVEELLSWFDIGTTEVSGKVDLAGKIDFSGATAAERKRNLNGSFGVRIADGLARRFQLLVRVLSFLDLSRWFSFRLPDVGREGIHFRSVSADFKVNHGIYATQNFFVDSDDLRITGAGELDGPKGEIDFIVAIRPFPGLDRAWNYIPILGTGLAAIKNSLLVASFHVKGPVSDPGITPAPLSTLSEFFYGALAIPKGLIGIPSTGAPQAALEHNTIDGK